MSLHEWGWDDGWEKFLDPDRQEQQMVARVVGRERTRWQVHTERGAAGARLMPGRADLSPVVGDWVLLEPGPMPADPFTIVRVLPRRSRFSRGAAGSGADEQVLAANVDRAWIVHGLDIPPNQRRLERYLAVAWESGAAPEIILTKADLTEDLESAVASVSQMAIGVPIRIVSAADAAAIQQLRRSLEPGRTIVLLGPSGVGKSTLINLLANQELATTGEVRAADRKGRHTTTRRELFRIAGGALLLDTPGIRELRVWDLGAGLDQVFPEIDELARQCRFRDCRHEAEPGCAVLDAVQAGRLDPGRLNSYRKLEAEAAWQLRKTDPLARNAFVSEHRTAMKTLKLHPKYGDRR